MRSLTGWLEMRHWQAAGERAMPTPCWALPLTICYSNCGNLCGNHYGSSIREGRFNKWLTGQNNPAWLHQNQPINPAKREEKRSLFLNVLQHATSMKGGACICQNRIIGYSRISFVVYVAPWCIRFTRRNYVYYAWILSTKLTFYLEAQASLECGISWIARHHGMRLSWRAPTTAAQNLPVGRHGCLVYRDSCQCIATAMLLCPIVVKVNIYITKLSRSPALIGKHSNQAGFLPTHNILLSTFHYHCKLDSLRSIKSEKHLMTIMVCHDGSFQSRDLEEQWIAAWRALRLCNRCWTRNYFKEARPEHDLVWITVALLQAAAASVRQWQQQEKVFVHDWHSLQYWTQSYQCFFLDFDGNPTVSTYLWAKTSK